MIDMLEMATHLNFLNRLTENFLNKLTFYQIDSLSVVLKD